MKDRTAHRVSTCSSFGPTLESESLPMLGEDRERERFRARAWRWSLVSLGLFWLGLVWLIASLG